MIADDGKQRSRQFILPQSTRNAVLDDHPPPINDPENELTKKEHATSPT